MNSKIITIDDQSTPRFCADRYAFIDERWLAFYTNDEKVARYGDDTLSEVSAEQLPKPSGRGYAR